MKKGLFGKSFTAATAAALLAVTAVGCSSGSKGTSSSGSTVTVKFANFSSSGDNEKYLAQMKDEFEKQHTNIKVQIETIAFGDYFTQMQTRVAAGQAPDAYELNFENFYSYAKKGVLLDLAAQFKTTKFDQSTINKQALAAFAADGKQYGLPASFSNVLLIYNKDLFDKAKVSYPTDKWMWKEMDDAAIKIRALDKNTFGISQGVQFFEFFKAAQQNGGNLLNADKTKFTVNTPENVETLKHLTDRILVANSMPTEAQLSGTGDWDLFKAGRLGMIITGVWAFPDFIKNVKFNWDVAIEPGNKKKATHFFSNGLVINKDTKVADAAFEWIKFMSAGKEAAKIRVDAGWELPASTYQDVLDTYLKAKPPENRKAVFDSLNYLITPPVIEQFNEMNDIIGRHLQEAAQGTKPAEQALKEAQAELEQKIKLQ
ncbi:MAG: sugar ABC transporter substrate-binding protein [Paenibacillaceae bacterium]|nr:sugar ABC transporter substrate-binding protein [Paenibacillaceae bacterium]